MDPKEKDLHALFRKRQDDQRKATTKRRKQGFSRPATCNDILSGLFAKDPNSLKKIEETKAILAWEKYVGAATLRHAKAEKIRNGTLIIKVSDPLWAQELSLLKQSLLDKYRRDFPHLRLTDLFFTR